MKNRRSFVSEMGVNFFEEIPNGDSFSTDLYSSYPSLLALVPADPFVSAATAYLLCSIGAVLPARAGSKVVPSVVQFTPIPVVDFFEVKPCSFCNYQVHQDGFLIRRFRDSSTALRVVTWATGTPYFRRIPFPLHEEVVVNSVNDGRLTLRKWNEAGSCIQVSSLAGRFCLADEPACLSLFNQN